LEETGHIQPQAVEVLAAKEETLCTSVGYGCLHDNVLLLLAGPHVVIPLVPQITLKPGTYASDSNNLYMLEDIGNTSSVRNMLTAFPTWRQKINQTWSPDTAYVQHLACDRHCQTPWSPTYWNTNMVRQQGVVMNNYMMNDNMMNDNMMNSNMIYNSGYLNNDSFAHHQII
jgi:hypothetical protein